MPRPSASSRDLDYVELRCASAFSFLEAASQPEDLADRAAELGLRAVALADRGGVYGIPRFHQAARQVGVDAIVGAKLDVTAGDPAGVATELLLLVESQRGYRNLSKLLTVAHERGGKSAARAGWNDVAEHAGGLVCLLRGDGSLTAEAIAGARTALGADRVWVDVSRHLDRRAEAAARRAAAFAEAHGVPIAASGDVRHAHAADRPLFDALTCLRHHTTLDAAGRRLASNAERHLVSPREMARRFADRPAWIAATRAIAERCAFRLHDLGYRFPTYDSRRSPAARDAGGESQAALLRRLAFEGARGRYGHPLPERVRRQIEHELAVIEKLDLAGYFLIVWDITRYARERRMLAQGRGSAANSAVCYALGITAVDPVGMELLFERFLSEERGEWPDIDIDLPSGDQREEVIQYVFRRYGAAKPGNIGAKPSGNIGAKPSGNIGTGAAMTANVITYRTRMAVREMGKVLGIAPDAIDRLSKILSTLELREGMDETRAVLRQGGVDPEAPRVQRLLDLVSRVRGLPRHLGQHSGGIVIAAGRLDEVVPIEPASMPGRRVVQWDKDDCADLGIIKIDLLGLGMLNALEHTIRLAREREGVAIDLAKLPPDDPATYAMIQRADTMGTFQIESRAQMATLPRMKPACFYDLVVEVAIIRPGPIVGKMVHPYLNRRAGREPVTVPHPSLEPILRRTLGVPLFQEQLLRIAMTAAGFSGGEAEELRRAMGFKRSQARMAKIETKLRRGMAERGITGAAQDDVVRGITSFALYGFPESHAASFALIAYASSWLKCHHPAAFLAGLLNAWPMGFYSPASLVKDAQRHGVEVRPIDVARSAWLCDLEERGAAVRLGLRFVRGLAEAAGRRIEAARAERPFAHAADLAKRAALARKDLLALAELGALASIVPAREASASRRAALWQVAGIERDPRSLFAGAEPPDADTPLPEMSPFEETLADYRASGITTGAHVMSHLRAGLAKRGVLSAAALRDVPNGRFVRTAGHVIVRQRPGSAKGLCFLTLEDETGTSNAVLTPEQFQRFRVPLHTARLVEIAGPLQNVEGVLHVRVKRLVPLSTARPVDAPPPKHYDAFTPDSRAPRDPEAALPDSHDYH
ncbi:MAG: error-prone DNA polymerase [Proteobacteria bacterium]|nr:MAG: error-prone DNA polymerase [Pseudomonadota bacterium]